MNSEKEKSEDKPKRENEKQAGKAENGSPDPSGKKNVALAPRSGQRPAFPFKRKSV